MLIVVSGVQLEGATTGPVFHANGSLKRIEKFFRITILAIQIHKFFQKRKVIEVRDHSQNFADTKS